MRAQELREWIKTLWPVVLGVLALYLSYTKLENRVSNIEGNMSELRSDVDCNASTISQVLVRLEGIDQSLLSIKENTDRLLDRL